MIRFDTLEKTSKEKLLRCFNSAFSDYSIPFHLSAQQLELKLHSEGIELKNSVGAFRESELIGFVLHGVKAVDGSKFAYNGGTGVVPAERGQALTVRMYNWFLPQLRENAFHQVILEVISDNEPAIRSYKRIGFDVLRSLNCYKGEIRVVNSNPDVRIREINNPDLELLCNMGELRPTWQNANEAIRKLGETTQFLGAYLDQRLAGYVIVNKTNNRILQLAVSKKERRKNIARTMLNHIAHDISTTSSMINVDAGYDSINLFLEKCGFVNFLQQKEMALKLSEL